MDSRRERRGHRSCFDRRSPRLDFACELSGEPVLREAQHRYRTLIVEDEVGAADLLVEFVGERPELHLCGVARDGLRAMSVLDGQKIDLVFLDVDLPGLSGLELLERVRERNEGREFYTIFTTAFAEYAVAAFDLGAVDFLQKPFGPERFGVAVDRFLERRAALPEAGGAEAAEPTRAGLVVSHRATQHLVRFHDIVYVAAHDRRCVIHLHEGEVVCTKALAEIEQRLPGDLFARIHRQSIVRLDQIKSMESQPGGRALIYLRDAEATSLPVGRSFVADLARRLGI